MKTKPVIGHSYLWAFYPTDKPTFKVTLLEHGPDSFGDTAYRCACFTMDNRAAGSGIVLAKELRPMRDRQGRFFHGI